MPHHNADVTKESTHTTPSSSSPTPPLHYTRQRNEAAVLSENDVPGHTLDRNKKESQFPWHERRTNCTGDKRSVSSILVKDNLTLLVMSFRSYLEELAEEMEMEKEDEC